MHGDDALDQHLFALRRVNCHEVLGRVLAGHERDGLAAAGVIIQETSAVVD